MSGWLTGTLPVYANVSGLEQLEIDEIEFRPAQGQPNSGWRKPLTSAEIIAWRSGQKKVGAKAKGATA